MVRRKGKKREKGGRSREERKGEMAHHRAPRVRLVDVEGVVVDGHLLHHAGEGVVVKEARRVQVGDGCALVPRICACVRHQSYPHPHSQSDSQRFLPHPRNSSKMHFHE